MTESLREQSFSGTIEPQCQYFVLRKKRLCRMTVRPGRQYCGEHEPRPKTADGQDDARIPCPNDPKHTVYVSKLEKHLTICNARMTEQPLYIVRNINAPTEVDTCLRIPLGQLSRDLVIQVIEKVNLLYDKHVKDNITVAPERPIHRAVTEEFSESDRAESSLRHLRQVSSLLWLVEDAGLVANNTCYVELGAGKGHMSYYACNAWCSAEARGGGGGGGGALLVDRASLRHKRDNKLRGRVAWRLRADLAHLALARVPLVAASAAVVGLAKHLCGVATDYALRCLTAEGVVQKARGAVLATCCHHRCDRAAFLANRQLQELGINGDELNVMLGIVSWATCGDGRSRGQRSRPDTLPDTELSSARTSAGSPARHVPLMQEGAESREPSAGPSEGSPATDVPLTQEGPESREPSAGPSEGSPATDVPLTQEGPESREPSAGPSEGSPATDVPLTQEGPESREPSAGPSEGSPATDVPLTQEGPESREPSAGPSEGSPATDVPLTRERREQAGRRAKQLLDWARVLYLRDRGFDARLCYYVPTTVSLENVCIVAKKLS